MTRDIIETQSPRDRSVLGNGRKPTISDIARQAGVSVWTVSHVLNKSSLVTIKSATRELVQDIATELGYRPNHAARALVGSKTNLAATWMNTRAEYSTYYGHMQHLLHKIARSHRYHCITEDVILDEVNRGDFSNLLNWPVDGVIACDVSGPVEAFAKINPNKSLAVVNIGGWIVESVDSVKVDLEVGAIAAVRHLIDIGCKRIAYISDPPFDTRATAYSLVMREAGRREEIISTPADSRVSSRLALEMYVSLHGLPDGVFCKNDEVAIGVSQAVKNIGAKAPDDIAIVGCDGIDDTEYQTPSISTLRVPAQAICEAAWDMLIRRTQEHDAPMQHQVFTPELVVRESSRR